MIYLKRMTYLALIAILWTPTLSLAAKCGGTNVNNLVSWESTEIAKGTTLATYRATSVIVSDDPTAPFHLAAGECIGSFLTGPDGKTRATGSCARRDKNGDILHEEWVVTGAGKGSSKHVGGTGKFANAAYTSQWESTQLHGKMAAVRWSGNCD
jgi:hypothetical protein